MYDTMINESGSVGVMRAEVLGGSPPQRLCAHQTFHMTWRGIEPRLPQ
jgi:hypothetical protein